MFFRLKDLNKMMRNVLAALIRSFFGGRFNYIPGQYNTLNL
ncbi:hypothetical protein FLJC2902T_22400 [Flavobacterium limnosediminis JC2902]|uniref:Uncharacterized protein n=1 Tax=Flavobacterium limnosediminis JC2902 TaxID=1341181 RepID=V6SKK3_9FLAO|nr:hypothetical protein FLJC2902T_22400 [Flavobacterium limnosediminis JC2902]